MERLRNRVGHALLVLGLVACVLGSFASTLHEIRVAHVVCAEHGELVELSQDGPVASVHPDEPSASAAHPGDDHDHGCATLLASTHGLPPLHAPPPAPWAKPHPTPPRVWAHASPRAPPLTWAPKTSPPLAS